MEEENWSDSWRVHPHTKRLLRAAEEAKDNYHAHLLGVCSASTDPAVRSAYGTYRMAVFMHAVMATGDEDSQPESQDG